MRDLHNNLIFTVVLPPTSTSDNTPFVSALFDRTGNEAVEFVIVIGSLVDADATFTVNVQHGDMNDGSDLVDVPTYHLLGTKADAGFDFAADNKTRSIGYLGGRTYQKVTVTPSNNTGAATIAILAVTGHPRRGR